MFAWALLWPILIFHTLPKVGLNLLFEKHESFDITRAIKSQHTELLALWESPPNCTNTVVTEGYDQSSYESLKSELRFNAHDVTTYLQDLSSVSEFDVLNQDGIILKWVKQRDTDNNAACTVPEELNRFNNIANSLLFKGLGKVFCKGCQKEYTTNQLECISDSLSAGWNFDRVKCSNGHLLSVAKGIHIHCRPN